MPAQSTMTERMIGAAKLDIETYEEVEHDESATGQAAGVVAMVAIAQAIAGVGGGAGMMIMGVVAAFVGWGIWAGVTYLIGDKLLGGTATWGELLRTLGFAQAPGLLIVLAVLPVLGGFVRLVVGIWVLITGFIGLRQALDLGNVKTLFTAVLGWLALMLVFALPMMLLAGIGDAMGAG